MKVMSKEKGLQEFIGFGRTIVLHENEIEIFSDTTGVGRGLRKNGLKDVRFSYKQIKSIDVTNSLFKGPTIEFQVNGVTVTRGGVENPYAVIFMTLGGNKGKLLKIRQIIYKRIEDNLKNNLDGELESIDLEKLKELRDKENISLKENQIKTQTTYKLIGFILFITIPIAIFSASYEGSRILEKVKQNSQRGSKTFVSEEIFGEKWPFTVSSGNVMCKKPKALIFTSNNGSKSRTYSLNGTAKARFGYPYPNEEIDIWKYDPSMPFEYKLRVPTTAIEEKARELCKF